MAIKLIANYAKRLGLPGYSSHQFSVSCETELTDLTQVHDEAARLYGLLQDSVDREIQQTALSRRRLRRQIRIHGPVQCQQQR